MGTVDIESFAAVTQTHLRVPETWPSAFVPGAGGLTGQAGGQTITKQNLVV
jgi:hypothetical protein